MSLANVLFHRKSIIACIFGMLFIFSGEVLANKGLEIALKSDENFDGYGDSSSEMTMELISKKGDVLQENSGLKGLKFLEMATNL